jgi:fatty acid desaturase
VDNWKNITNSQISVRKKCFGGTFTFSKCHIIGLDTGNLVLIVFVTCQSSAVTISLLAFTLAFAFFFNYLDMPMQWYISYLIPAFLVLGCHHVWVFSDHPKSVSELVTYVTSTLSSSSDDCCHVLSVSLMYPL